MQLCSWPDGADTGDQDRLAGSRTPSYSCFLRGLSGKTVLKDLQPCFGAPVVTRGGPGFEDKQPGPPTARKGLVPSGEG